MPAYFVRPEVILEGYLLQPSEVVTPRAAAFVAGRNPQRMGTIRKQFQVQPTRRSM